MELIGLHLISHKSVIYKDTLRHYLCYRQNQHDMNTSGIRPHFLMVNLKRKIYIPTSQIIMLEGSGNYTIVHLRYQRKQLYAKCISVFEEMLLPEGFIRVHRGFIVNPQYVIKYDSIRCIISLRHNLEATVSRRKKEEISSLFCD